MTNPEQTLPVVGWLDPVSANAFEAFRWIGVAHHTVALTPHAPAEAEIARLRAELADRDEGRALHLALTRDAQDIAFAANARAEKARAERDAALAEIRVMNAQFAIVEARADVALADARRCRFALGRALSALEYDDGVNKSTGPGSYGRCKAIELVRATLSATVEPT